MPATKPTDYHCVEAWRGREFIIRMTTGTDVYKALQKFAKDKKNKFGKIHAAFMGGFSPAKTFMWTLDNSNPKNWHNETGARAIEGTIVKSVVEVFVTEVLGFEELLPINYNPVTDGAQKNGIKKLNKP